MKKPLFVLAILIAFCTTVFALPVSPPSGWKIQSGSTRALYPAMLKAYTVATLPTGVTNDLVLATDCTAADDCSSGGGTHVKILVKTATGWAIIGDGQAAGAGDVGGVGDCTGGDCLDGTSDGGTYIRLYDGNSHYTGIVSADVTGNVTITLPSATGTLLNQALASGYVWVGSGGGVATATDSAAWDKDASNDYTSGGTDVALADGGTGASLSDPGADRVMFWDDSASAVTWLTVGTGLTITDTTITASGSGDITDAGPGYSSGAAFTDGVVSTGSTMFVWEGTTDDTNEFIIAAPSADPGADITFTFPGETGTGVVGPAGFGTDNILVKTDGTGNLTQATGISVADTTNIISGTQGITFEGGANDTTLIPGSPAASITYTLPSNTGTPGQYLQLGSSNVFQWGDPAGSGDMTAVGSFTSGAAFTEGDTSNGILYFEGATANDYEIALTGRNPGADVTIYLPAEDGDIVLGPANGFGTDNRLMKTDGTGSLTQITGITVADTTNDVSGVGNVGAATGTLTTSLSIGSDPADGGAIRLDNAAGILFEASPAGTDVNALTVTSGEVVQIGASGASGVTVTPAATFSAGATIATGQTFSIGSNQINSGDLIDGTKIANADLGDVGVASGVWSVENDSHAHTNSTITLASTDLSDTSNMARLDADNTFTGTTNTVGNANTDILAVQSTMRGVGRAVSIDDDTTTSPTYATGTNELYVEGDIETDGTVYANQFISTGTGESYISLSNNSSGRSPGAGEFSFYFETDGSNRARLSINGSEKEIANLEDAQTFSGAKTFSAATSFTLGATGAGQLLIYEDSDDGSNKITITAQAIAADYTLTLPTTDGNSGQYLKTDGSGSLSWDSPTATAAGSDTQVQFNDGGSALGGDASLTFNKTTGDLTVGSNGEGGAVILYNELGGTDYNATIQPNASQAAAATITLPAATGTLSTLGNAETFTGAKTFDANVTMADARVLIFDESAADPNDADIQLSAADGVFKIASANGANNEDLTIDLDQTSNRVILGSSTGVTRISSGSLQFATTGAILGGINISTKTDATYTVGTDDAGESYGTLFINGDNDAIAFTLPSAVAGMNACFMQGQGSAGAITVTPGASDYLVVDGVRGTAATAYASTGAGGDKICVVAVSADDWIVTSKSGTWSE